MYISWIFLRCIYIYIYVYKNIYIYIYIPSKIQVSKKKRMLSTCKNWTFFSSPPKNHWPHQIHLLGRGGLTQGNSQAFAKEQGLRSDGASNGRRTGRRGPRVFCQGNEMLGMLDIWLNQKTSWSWWLNHLPLLKKNHDRQNGFIFPNFRVEHEKKQ